MPYVLKLYSYLFFAAVAAFFIARWLSPLGLLVNLICAFVAVYVTIIVGRRILKRDKL